MDTSSFPRLRNAAAALLVTFWAGGCSGGGAEEWDLRIPPIPMPPFPYSYRFYSVLEGDSEAQIEIALNHSAEGVASLDYVTRDRTAIAGVDYQGVSGTVTWEPGESGVKIITVPILDDDTFERDEVFEVEIVDLHAVAGSIDPVVTVKIVDDEITLPMFHALTREGELLTVVVGPDACRVWSVEAPELSGDEQLQELRVVDGQLVAITTMAIPYAIDPLGDTSNAIGPESGLGSRKMGHVFEVDGELWRLDLPETLEAGRWHAAELNGPFGAEWAVWNVSHRTETLRSVVTL